MRVYSMLWTPCKPANSTCSFFLFVHFAFLGFRRNILFIRRHICSCSLCESHAEVENTDYDLQHPLQLPRSSLHENK